MEALTAASVAALTIYDMVKGVDRGAEIRHVRLLEKTRRQVRGVAPAGGRRHDGAVRAKPPKGVRGPRRGG